MKKTIITILDDSRVKKCYAGCGINWSKAEELENAREHIKRQLSGDFILEHLDMAKPEVSEKFSKIVQKAKKADLLYPLLIINEDIRISGDFDLRMLTDMMDASRELGIV